jgi:hypothetical protein
MRWLVEMSELDALTKATNSVLAVGRTKPIRAAADEALDGSARTLNTDDFRIP